MLPVFPFLLSILILDSGKFLVKKKNSAQIVLLGILIITFLPAASAVSQRMLTLPEAEYIKYRMTFE